MNKQLIFSFFANKEWKDNRANLLHIKMLKHYKDAFNKVLICINFCDIDNNNIIEIEKIFIDIFWDKELTFKIQESTSFNESKILYDEIVNKLDTFDSLIFFSHNKGISNYSNKYYDSEILDYWIIGLYYYNLEDIKQVENSLIQHGNRFFGGFLSNVQENDKYLSNINNFIYYGSVYWLNPMGIFRDISIGLIGLPPFSDRWYSERLPGELYTWDENCVEFGLSTYNEKVFYNYNPYFSAKQVIELTIKDLDKFKSFL